MLFSNAGEPCLSIKKCNMNYLQHSHTGNATVIIIIPVTLGNKEHRVALKRIEINIYDIAIFIFQFEESIIKSNDKIINITIIK